MTLVVGRIQLRCRRHWGEGGQCTRYDSLHIGAGEVILCPPNQLGERIREDHLARMQAGALVLRNRHRANGIGGSLRGCLPYEVRLHVFVPYFSGEWKRSWDSGGRGCVFFWCASAGSGLWLDGNHLFGRFVGLIGSRGDSPCRHGRQSCRSGAGIAHRWRGHSTCSAVDESSARRGGIGCCRGGARRTVRCWSGATRTTSARPPLPAYLYRFDRGGVVGSTGSR